VLTVVGDAPYRRQIKGMRNLNEGRHDLARHVFHGRRGELYRHHVRVHGHYTFALLDLGGRAYYRVLRDPDAADEQ